MRNLPQYWGSLARCRQAEAGVGGRGRRATNPAEAAPAAAARQPPSLVAAATRSRIALFSAVCNFIYCTHALALLVAVCDLHYIKKAELFQHRLLLFVFRVCV
jgi:hypothetical protein